MSLTSRHAIAFLATGYKVADIAPFFNSLRRVGYRGKVLMFTHSLGEDVYNFLQDFDVEYIPVMPSLFAGRHYPWAKLLGDVFSKICKPAYRGHYWRFSELWLHLINGRHTAYLRYFENTFRRFDELLLIDVRDAIFQAHPFSPDYGCDIGFFQEAPTQTIGCCPSNSEWILRAYGKKELATLSNKVVICAGVTYLRQQAILPYLAAMVDGCIRANVRNIVDQGIHNYLAYHELLPGGKIIPQSHSPVWNIGCNSPESLRFNSSGYLIDEAGNIPAIIHQYDRLPITATALPKLLGS